MIQTLLCAIGLHDLDTGRFENDLSGQSDRDGPLVFVCRCVHCGAKVTA